MEGNGFLKHPPAVSQWATGRQPLGKAGSSRCHSQAPAAAAASEALTFDSVLAFGQLADVLGMLQFIPIRQRTVSEEPPSVLALKPAAC